MCVFTAAEAAEAEGKVTYVVKKQNGKWGVFVDGDGSPMPAGGNGKMNRKECVMVARLLAGWRHQVVVVGGKA